MLKETLLTIFLTNPYGLGNITFNKDVKPILKNNCVQCHKGITNYIAAYGYKDKIARKINGNIMPPNFRLKLTDYEKAVINKWVKTGAKK